MREIKFRAWHNKENEMIYNVFPSEDTIDAQWLEWMQYTGLKDKNGKEICEGDILEFTDKWEWYRGTYRINMMFANAEELTELKKKYDAEPMHRFEVTFDPHNGYNISEYDLSQDRFEVIGNIYENPELLK